MAMATIHILAKCNSSQRGGRHIKSFNKFLRIIIKHNSAKLECSHYKSELAPKENDSNNLYQCYYCRSRSIITHRMWGKKIFPPSIKSYTGNYCQIYCHYSLVLCYLWSMCSLHGAASVKCWVLTGELEVEG